MAERRIKDLFVEKALLGEPATQQAMAALTDEERAEVSARMAELQKENQAILDRYPAARIAKEVERRAAEAQKPARRWVFALVPALAAASLAIVFAAGGLGTQHSGSSTGNGTSIGAMEPDDILLKGGAPELHIYKKHEGGKPEILRSGSAVRRGDVVQLSYNAAGRCCGVIVSIDGRGAATLHHPASPSEPALLQAGGEVPLAKAYELDDAPQFERFFFITSKKKQPIDAQRILTAAQQLAKQPDAPSASLGLNDELSIQDVLLHKETTTVTPKANPTP